MDRKLKQQLIEKTASSLQQPVSVVEDLLSWMFKDALKALKIYTQVELSGWGTMLMSHAKLKRRIKRMEQIKGRLLAQEETEARDVKLEGVENSLTYYYSRLYGMEENKFQAGVGGMEEQIHSPGQNERAHTASGTLTAGNMSELP